MFEPSRRGAIVTLLAAAGLAGCSGANFDASTALGKQAVIDEVNHALSSGDCASAINTIAPVLNSVNTDDSIRLLAASAYGCNAHINFFTLIGDIAQKQDPNPPSTQLFVEPAGGMLRFVALEFPSTLGKDYASESGQLAEDILQSILKPGVVVLPALQINPKTPNPGSPFAADHSDNSNTYMTFVSLATMGALENRYGYTSTTPANTPYPSGKKANILPWTSPAAMTGDGCAYAASLLDFLDSTPTITKAIGGGAASSLSAALGIFQQAIYTACIVGCRGNAPTAAELATMGGLLPADWTNTGCAFAAPNCDTCPISLRDRSSCTAATTSMSACAAAGIVQFINKSPIGWLDGP